MIFTLCLSSEKFGLTFSFVLIKKELNASKLVGPINQSPTLSKSLLKGNVFFDLFIYILKFLVVLSVSGELKSLYFLQLKVENTKYSNLYFW